MFFSLVKYHVPLKKTNIKKEIGKTTIERQFQIALESH
jgi:hypothetical protein